MRREAYLSDLKNSGIDFVTHIESLEGTPVWMPEVYVVTDPGTFSAAYDLMYRLRRLGAKIVGVPPSQSANAFVDPTPFELPVTKLKGAISRTAVIYPDMPEEERAFIPDFPMKWIDFKKYNFDVHAEILYILDIIKGATKK